MKSAPARARRFHYAGGLVALTLLLLLLPVSAAAAPITVNSIADTVANDGSCTLREAIGSANGNTASGAMAGECAAGGASDVIGFSADPFNGQLGDTIAVGSALPAITTDTDIAGGLCATAAGANGPCAGIHGPAGGSGLVVQSDQTSISGVAVTGAATGIEIGNTDGVSGFSAGNNWLGVRLDGSPGANGTGLFVGPDSAGAQIGDGTVAGRNVFAFNSEVGLDLEGADDNTVQGNYFGVKPDGTTSAASPVNVEITGLQTGGVDATGNVVGGTLNASQAASPACDGPCNVIATSTAAGVDLGGDNPGQDELPAGQTTVSGNLVGFDATGLGELPNANTGIQIDNANDVTIGGASALDANHVVVVGEGIESSGNAENQLIRNNLIGLNYAGTEMAATPVPAGSHGILARATSGGDTVVVGNRVAGPGTMDDPIETIGGPALVAGNVIGMGTGGEALVGGATGIDVVLGSPGSGTTVFGNFVQNSTQAGIELQAAGGATVTGNVVLGSGFRGGIWARLAFGSTPSADNTIGGDIPAQENLIAGTDGPAISIEGNVNIRNDIARNRGSNNAGPFIDLGSDGAGNSPSGPNGGIQAPAIVAAGVGAIGGTAQPGATVMVFSKTTALPGEIAGFLGSAVADPSGSWQLVYADPVAAGTMVGASQTGDNGTSELAFATTAADSTPPPPDTDPPQTAITKSPPKRSTRSWAKFRFISDESGSAFFCKLDRRPFRLCRSPRTYRHLRPGRHTFRVKAVDAAGNADPTSAKRRFAIRP